NDQPVLSIHHVVLSHPLPTPLCTYIFCDSYTHRDLHSFPTRRSSDLLEQLRFSPPALPSLLRHPGGHIHDDGEIGSARPPVDRADRKSTRLNSSHVKISYAVFCLKKKKNNNVVNEIL